MKHYVKLQIIKHALQHYIQRPDADPKDIAKEQLLLNQVEKDIEKEKQRCHIN